MFDTERDKAASDKDFFLFITTANIELLNIPGMVHAGNWKDYFGPFSGRMFLGISDNTFHINTATFSSLQWVVGRTGAKEIIAKRPFRDISHAVEETGISEGSSNRQTNHRTLHTLCLQARLHRLGIVMFKTSYDPMINPTFILVANHVR